MADNIILINCNDTSVPNDIVNFTGIGLTKDSIPVSNTTNLNDSLKITKESGATYYTTSVYQKAQRLDSSVKTSDFTVDMSKSIYYINTSGGNITATWDDSLGKDWCVTFKIIDATNSFIITTSSGTGLFETNALPYTTLLVVRDSITVHFDGTDLNII